MVESTAIGAGGCFFDEWQRAQRSAYLRHFFPWWYEPGYAISLNDRGPSIHCHSGPERAQRAEGEESAVAIGHPPTIDDFTAEELELIAKHRLTATQIAFRREVRASFRGLARQEFAEDPVSCFIASGECVFDLDVVQHRLKRVALATNHRPPAIDIRDNGRLLIFWPPRPGGSYIIGVDPAGGGCDGDYACAQVIERVTGLQCAELHGHIPPRELASRIAALGREYNHALIAVERNNHGYAVLAHLDASEHYDAACIYEQNRQLGWLTSAVSRPRMIELFAALLARQPDLFSSARLLTECRTFVRHPDGAAAATAGAHDDCVMAMAIAQAVRMERAGRPKPQSEIEFASLAR